MIVGVLMKQVAIAIVLSVLLYCYSLIMGTADNVLPWALKILMIALVTVTVFIYRKPFQHLFSAVGYGAIGSQERAQLSLRDAGTAGAAPLSRAVRWARRTPARLATAAATGGVGAAAAASSALASEQEPAAAPPVTVPDDGGDGRRVSSPASGATGRARALTETGGATARPAPPLDLPARSGGSADNSWSRGAGRPAGSRGRSGGGGAPPPSLPLGGNGTSTGSGPAWPSTGWSGGGAVRPKAPDPGTA